MTSLAHACHCDLENGVHFHRHAARQRAHADRGAGMLAGIAEHRHEQVGGAIGHFRLLGEIGRGIDEDA